MNHDLQEIYPKLICTKHELGYIAIKKIEAYLLEPGTDAWEQIHRFVLLREPFVNLWTAVCEVDPNFPTIGRVVDEHGLIWMDWKIFPSPEMLKKALFWAAEKYDRNS